MMQNDVCWRKFICTQYVLILSLCSTPVIGKMDAEFTAIQNCAALRRSHAGGEFRLHCNSSFRPIWLNNITSFCMRQTIHYPRFTTPTYKNRTTDLNPTSIN
jgi:hypothetical protein